MVIIPIGKLNRFRNGVPDILRDLRSGIIIILLLVRVTEIHIVPDDRFQVIFPADAAETVQMTVVNIKRTLIAVQIHELSASEIMCFVHAQMNPAGIKSVAPEFNHLFQQDIRFFTIHQNHIIRVADLIVRAPAHDRLKMPQRLNRGNHLNPEFLRICVDLADFLNRICSAHVTEIVLSGNLIRVFCIKHCHVVAE